MTDFEPEAPSKSQEKRDAAEISKLAERLCALKSSQLALIPYPNIINAVTTYQKITKGKTKEENSQETKEIKGTKEIKETKEEINKIFI